MVFVCYTWFHGSKYLANNVLCIGKEKWLFVYVKEPPMIRAVCFIISGEVRLPFWRNSGIHFSRALISIFIVYCSVYSKVEVAIISRGSLVVVAY